MHSLVETLYNSVILEFLKYVSQNYELDAIQGWWAAALSYRLGLS